MDAETYFLAVERTGATYQGRLHRGDPGKAVVLENLDLGPDAQITLDGQVHRLGTLVDALTAFDTAFLKTHLDLRGQLALGAHLYRQSFGRIEPYVRLLPAEADVRLRILADEAKEDVVRLPWVLLSRDGVFLCTTGWSVGLCHQACTGRHCELPPSPRMLVAIPEPQDMPPTGGEAHLEELEDRLATADPLLVRGGNLHVARTWDDFRVLAEDVRPSVVYYYGHGEGDWRSSQLLFEGPGKKRHEVPLADFALSLRRGGEAPLLAYVNCCQGDAGGVLGAGWQLGTFIPAVLTNRTVAYVDAARKQAAEFWDATLLRGVAPHAAVSGLYSRLGDMGLSLRDVRWMTPVFHGTYDTWRSNPPPASRQAIADPHWEVRLDREEQFSLLAHQTRTMMRQRRPVCRAYVWYGREGQGVDAFHDRVRYDLRDDLEDTTLHRIDPLWPDELADPHRSFTDMVTRAFEVSALDALPGRIRTLKHGETRRRILVFVRHASFRSGALISPSILRAYLEWWHYNVTPRLRDAGGFALIGLSFVAKDPGKLRRAVQQEVSGSEVHSIVRVLDELQPITREHLEDFLAAYEISLPARRRDRELERILAETHGGYELTVEALKELQNRAWHLAEDVRSEETFLADGDFGL